jgi:hypothetical protein
MVLLTEGRPGIDRLVTEVNESSTMEVAVSAFRSVATHLLDGEMGPALDSLRKLQSQTSVPLGPWIDEIRLLKLIIAGEAGGAASDAIAAADTDSGYLDNARTLTQAARAALWSRDPSGVESAIATLERFKPNGHPWVRIMSSALRSGAEALSGAGGGTAAEYLRSIAEADEIGATFDAALLQMDVAALGVGDEESSRQMSEAAKQRFVDLGARGLWERLNAPATRNGWRSDEHV